MAVRRLAPADQQPASFGFSPADLEWVKRQIAKYPEGRQSSAVIPLLWRAQAAAGGWVPQKAIEHVAEILSMPVIRVFEIATFYTMFNLAPVGRHHLQVCGTTPCVLRGAEDIKHVCEHRIGHPFEVTADGAFSWEEVECLGACVNAPLVQIGADRYEDLSVETFTRLLDDLAAGRPVKEGPQVDRQRSAPIGGPTTLHSFDTGRGPRPGEEPEPKEPVLSDAEAKRPGESAKMRDAPIPTGPVADASKGAGVGAPKEG